MVKQFFIEYTVDMGPMNISVNSNKVSYLQTLVLAFILGRFLPATPEKTKAIF